MQNELQRIPRRAIDGRNHRNLQVLQRADEGLQVYVGFYRNEAYQAFVFNKIRNF